MLGCSSTAPSPPGSKADPGEPGQPGPHAPRQLTGRLAGEGQPEHLTGVGVAVGDQPDDASGHRLGLACTRTGDHHERPGRRGDHGGLLVGGREQPERVGQFGRTVARGHDSTSERGLRGAHGPHRAVRAPVVDARGELRALACGGGLPHAGAPVVACLRSQRVLGPFGGARSTGLAEVDQPAATGFVAVRHEPLRDRQLVHGQLRVALRVVLADGTLARS